MQKQLLTLLIVSFVLTHAPAKGHALETDKAAHLGIAYTINTAAYGFYKKGFRMNRFEAFLFAAFATSAICLTKEMLDPRFDEQDLVYDGIGMGLSGFTVFAFEF